MYEMETWAIETREAALKLRNVDLHKNAENLRPTAVIRNKMVLGKLEEKTKLLTYIKERKVNCLEKYFKEVCFIGTTTEGDIERRK